MSKATDEQCLLMRASICPHSPSWPSKLTEAIGTFNLDVTYRLGGGSVFGDNIQDNFVVGEKGGGGGDMILGHTCQPCPIPMR